MWSCCRTSRVARSCLPNAGLGDSVSLSSEVTDDSQADWVHRAGFLRFGFSLSLHPFLGDHLEVAGRGGRASGAAVAAGPVEPRVGEHPRAQRLSTVDDQLGDGDGCRDTAAAVPGLAGGLLAGAA